MARHGHALVMGGSLPGLLAARVLSDHFDEVTVIERDPWPAIAEPRKGVPQGRHVHGLLCRGWEILDQLFPGLEAELLTAGATWIDMGADFRWHHLGQFRARRSSNLRAPFMSRPLLEWHISQRVAAPLGPIVGHGFPSNRRYHYERVPRFPEGLLALGDAVCSFNPIYGQGMTVSILEAMTLHRCLEEQRRCKSLTGLSSKARKAFSKIIDVAWGAATGEDLRYPEVDGHRPRHTRLRHWYMHRVHHAAARDPEVALRILRVTHLLKPPSTLFSPGILLRMVRAMCAARFSEPRRSSRP